MVHTNGYGTYDFTFTSDWFSRTKFLMMELFDRINPTESPISMVEIGAWEGASTLWFLTNACVHSDSRLITVDPWPRELFFSNLEKLRPSDRSKLTHLQEPSSLGLRSLPVGKYDIIFVDGSHYPDDVMRDAIQAFDLIKVGGYLIFDDYHNITDTLPYLTPESKKLYLKVYDNTNINRRLGLVYERLPPYGLYHTTMAINSFATAFAPCIESVPVLNNYVCLKVFRKIHNSFSDLVTTK